MTIITGSGAPEMTYSKTRGVVAVLSGRLSLTMNPLRVLKKRSGWMQLTLIALSLVVFLSSSFHETEKNGVERFHSEACHKLLCMQAVSSIKAYSDVFSTFCKTDASEKFHRHFSSLMLHFLTRQMHFKCQSVAVPSCNSWIPVITEFL